MLFWPSWLSWSIDRAGGSRIRKIGHGLMWYVPSVVRVPATLTILQLYTLGYVKLICTFVKYIPQVVVNFNRQSTIGWSITQILFDITGGVLSLLQLIIDASFQGDWSGITGNSLKLGLSNISIAFDIIFIVQHFVLYRGLDDRTIEADASEQPLLG